MDLQCRSRLKIRWAPSCKISAVSSQTSSSFHGSCRHIKKKGCSNLVRQPLIFHIFDPEIIVVRPEEFMCVVQRLTGSPYTCKLLCTSMRKSIEMESLLRVPDVQLMQQSSKDPLKEETPIILAPACLSNPDLCMNEAPSSPNASDLISDLNPPQAPSSPNPSDLISEEIKYAPELPLSTQANISLLSATPMSSDELSNRRGPPWSPVSPNSSLTTTSYHTDNLSTEGGASPYREAAFSCLEEEGNCINTLEAEEDGSSHFFAFSGDSYYGTFDASQHEVEFQYGNVLDSFSQFIMPHLSF